MGQAERQTPRVVQLSHWLADFSRIVLLLALCELSICHYPQPRLNIAISHSSCQLLARRLGVPSRCSGGEETPVRVREVRGYAFAEQTEDAVAAHGDQARGLSGPGPCAMVHAGNGAHQSLGA